MRRENSSVGQMRLKTIKGLMEFTKYHLATTTVITILGNMNVKASGWKFDENQDSYIVWM